jgi:4-hydroxybenzoate polyprenyltransferase
MNLSWEVGAISASLRRLTYHLKTLYLFTSNYNVILILWTATGTLCAERSLSSSSNSSASDRTLSTGGKSSLSSIELQWLHTLKGFSLSLLWVTVVGLGFSISNQRHPSSIAEDSINKPWRPLPSGRITPHATTVVLIITSLLGLLLSCYIGGLTPYLVQLAGTYVYNDLGGGNGHSFFRDLLNAIGLTSWMFGCMDVARGPSSKFSEYELNTSVLLVAAVVSTIAIQDFRDLEGDRKCGRHTLPMLLGEDLARLALATSILCWSYGTMAVLHLPLMSVVPVLGTVIAARLLCCRDRKADKVNLELWYAWFAAISFTLITRAASASASIQVARL